MSHRPRPLHRAAGTIAIKPLVRNGFTVPLWSLSRPALGHCCGPPLTASIATPALGSRVPDAVQRERASREWCTAEPGPFQSPVLRTSRWLRSAKTGSPTSCPGRARGPAWGRTRRAGTHGAPRRAEKKRYAATLGGDHLAPPIVSANAPRFPCVGFVRPKWTPSRSDWLRSSRSLPRFPVRQASLLPRADRADVPPSPTPAPRSRDNRDQAFGSQRFHRPFVVAIEAGFGTLLRPAREQPR